ncbi:hypothetical protein [Sphingomonas rubra]|uniref:Uncharacterized protein n=1 Tax=Sphingomonas rubra TaxID=634430 RepID=A0A1I5TT71_9SPHN|nr:hypothetical protein [Sphingomonas rubra]SFP86101.1 hypothetical protein SAMN04488241_10927 [Sphingomonas rubra]
MNNDSHGDRRQALAAIIAEALHLADSLDLSLVGISLTGALERLTGHGLAIEPPTSSLH